MRNRRSLATRTTTFRCPQRRLTVRQRVHTATFIFSYCENTRGRRFDKCFQWFTTGRWLILDGGFRSNYGYTSDTSFFVIILLGWRWGWIHWIFFFDREISSYRNVIFHCVNKKYWKICKSYKLNVRLEMKSNKIFVSRWGIELWCKW